MVTVEGSGACSCHVSVNNEGTNEVTVCKMCKEYENQLKEALEELNTIQMVNKLLQKELLSLTTPKTTWETDLDSNMNKGDQTANTGWTLVTAKMRKNQSKKTDIGETVKKGHFNNTSNRFTPLTKALTDNDDTTPVNVNSVHSTKGSTKAQQHKSGPVHTNKVSGGVPSKCSKNRKKILILGDSHTRGLAEEVQTNIGKDFAVEAMVKPGANIEAILDSTDSVVSNLTKNDVCIIWGGTRDVVKNESNQGLRLLKNFTERHQHTNFFLMGVPHRYDLEMRSCVNREIIVFNGKLKKLSKLIDNLREIDVTTDREMFTRHGLHMNRMGKELTARKTATEVSVLFQANKSNPIVLQWKEEEGKKRTVVDMLEVYNVNDAEVNKKEPPGNPDSITSDLALSCISDKNDAIQNQEGSKLKLESDDFKEPNTREIRTSSRQKRLPTMRSKDFLWTRV